MGELQDARTPAERADESFSEFGDALDALEAMALHTGDCVKAVDLDGRILKWNRACEEFYGWRSDEVVGEKLPHVPQDLRLRTLSDILSVASSGRVVERESQQQRADGSRVVVRLVLIPFTDRDGHVAGVLSLANEVSGDERMEQQREDFVRAVSGELCDPLTAARGLVQLLSRPAISEDRDRREKVLAALDERLETMSTVLDDLLLVSNMAEGALLLTRQPVELPVLVTDIVASLGPDAGRVMLDFDPAIPRALVDVARLTRALRTLIDSALDRSPKGAPVGVSVYGVPGQAVIEVSDAGKSLSVEASTEVFEPFSPIAAREGAGSLGIGLYLAKEIAQAHGGSLGLSPDRGGVCFVLRLPLDGGPPVDTTEGIQRGN